MVHVQDEPPNEGVEGGSPQQTNSGPQAVAGILIKLALKGIATIAQVVDDTEAFQKIRGLFIKKHRTLSIASNAARLFGRRQRSVISVARKTA